MLLDRATVGFDSNQKVGRYRQERTLLAAQAAAGGGSIAGIAALAARYGLFAAVRIGLGGRFGGGAGRS